MNQDTVVRRNTGILIVSCFTLNLAISLVYGTLPLITLWQYQGDTIDYSLIKQVLGAAPMIIPFIAILVGLNIGKRGDVDKAYSRYVAGLFIGGLATGATLALVYLLVQDEAVKVIMEVGAIYSVTGLLDVTGCIFSGIALAWFHTGIDSKHSLVTGLARGVALYKLWSVARTAIIKITWLRTRGTGISVPGMYAYILSILDIPLSLIYLYFLYRVGTHIDMKEKYMDVVYTILALEVAGAIIVFLVSQIGYELNILDILLTLASRIIMSGLRVLGARFALVSYGYFKAMPESNEPI